MDFNLLISNGPLVVLIAIILGFIGKYLFASKSDLTNLNKDMNSISQKVDGGFHALDMKIVTANNSTVQNFAEKLNAQTKEILDEVYKKFLTKEMSEKQEQINKELAQRQECRMDKLENSLEYIRQKVDKNEVDNKVNAEKLDNILDILKKQHSD